MSVFDLMGKSQNVEICEEDYGYEIGGDMAAFEEAFSELADLREMFADKNAEGVKAIHESMQSGVTMESAVEEFRQSAVMEGFLGSVKDRIIKMLKALKAKIVAFFKSALRYFNNIWMDNKKFVEKYGEEAKNKDLEGFKFDMFNYDLSKFDPKNVLSGDVMSKVDAQIRQDAGEKVDKHYVVNLMADKLNVSGAADNAAIQKKLAELLRGGTQKHEVAINASKISEFIKAIVDGEEIEAAKDAQGVFEDAIDEFMKKVESEKEDNSEEKDEAIRNYGSKVLSTEASYFTTAKDIGMGAFRTFTAVAKERNSAYRACIAKALHFSAKK